MVYDGLSTWGRLMYMGKEQWIVWLFSWWMFPTLANNLVSRCQTKSSRRPWCRTSFLIFLGLPERTQSIWFWNAPSILSSSLLVANRRNSTIYLIAARKNNRYIDILMQTSQQPFDKSIGKCLALTTWAFFRVSVICLLKLRHWTYPMLLCLKHPVLINFHFIHCFRPYFGRHLFFFYQL